MASWFHRNRKNKQDGGPISIKLAKNGDAANLFTVTITVNDPYPAHRLSPPFLYLPLLVIAMRTTPISRLPSPAPLPHFHLNMVVVGEDGVLSSAPTLGNVAEISEYNLESIVTFF